MSRPVPGSVQMQDNHHMENFKKQSSRSSIDLSVKRSKPSASNSFSSPPSILDLLETLGPAESKIERDKISSVKKIHIYDFDKCLLKTPEPNPLLFRKSGIELLESQQLTGGGWWMDTRVLQLLLNDDYCDQQMWEEKWWNRSLVDLAKQSFEDQDAFSVLISNRGHDDFQSLIKQLLARRQLYFDGYLLQRKFSGHYNRSILEYKINMVLGLVSNFPAVEQIITYESNIKHGDKIRQAIEAYCLENKRDIFVNIVIANDWPVYYNPVQERNFVTKLIEDHNMELMTNPMSKVKIGHIEMSITVMSSQYTFDTVSLCKLGEFLQSRMAESQFAACHINDCIPINPKGVLPPDFEEYKGEIVEWKLIKVSHSTPHAWEASVIPHTSSMKHVTGDNARTITVAHNPNPKGDLPFNFSIEELEDPLLLKTTIDEKKSIQLIRRRH